MIYGTPEYKQWREIRQGRPAAVMVTKTIKKNANKRTATKNMKVSDMSEGIATPLRSLQ